MVSLDTQLVPKVRDFQSVVGKATWCAMQGSNLRLVAAATALSAGFSNTRFEDVRKWCAMQGSNLRLLACEASALPLS